MGKGRDGSPFLAGKPEDDIIKTKDECPLTQTCMSTLAENSKDGPQNSDEDFRHFYSFPKRIFSPKKTLVILIIRKKNLNVHTHMSLDIELRKEVTTS